MGAALDAKKEAEVGWLLSTTRLGKSRATLGRHRTRPPERPVTEPSRDSTARQVEQVELRRVNGSRVAAG
jgi:hypothetical protein